MKPDTLFVGVRGHVVAINQSTGIELWSTKLRSGITVGTTFVTLLVEGERVFAHSQGNLFCLDANTGFILWRNQLAGMGYEVATLATAGFNSSTPAALHAMGRNNATGAKND